MESHRFLDLEVTICGIATTCLIDSSSMHNFVDRKTLDKLGLQINIREPLEITLVDGSKITIDKVGHITIKFCKEVKHPVLYHAVDTLSSPLILGMQCLTNTNPTIQWLDYDIDLPCRQSIVILKGWVEIIQQPKVELCSAKAGIQKIRKGEQAWFMMLRAPYAACLYRVDSSQGNSMVVHDQSNNPALAS